MENQRIVELTNKEKKRLSEALLGYGKLTSAGKKTGLHINTLSLVNMKGSGKPATIEAIRMHLIGYEDNRVVCTNV